MLLGLKIIGHQHYRRAGGIDVMGIFGIGQEGNCSRMTLFYFGEGIYYGIAVSLNSATGDGGDLRSCKLHQFIIIQLLTAIVRLPLGAYTQQRK